MKNLRPLLFSIVVLLVLSVSCCKNDSLVVQTNASNNSTVITNKPNSFSFVVDASLYYYSEALQLQFNAYTMAVAMTISGYSSGSGSVVIKDSSDTTIYQKDLGSNIVSSDVIRITHIPKTINLTLKNYTGKIVIAVTGK